MKFIKNKNQLVVLLITLLAFFLRFFWLDQIPNSLYTDEVSQGYNAYSVLKTGKDEHGVSWPISFRSFGDWKPPIPTYLMMPFISLFGLNEWAVRLPSAILGIFTVYITYLLTLEIFNHKPEKKILAYFSAFFLAISPWHILQSRSAMLVMVALFFFETAVYFFIKGQEKRKFLYYSIVTFVLSIYSYYGLRVIVPLMIMYLFFVYRHNFTKLVKTYFFCTLLGFLLLLPLISAFSHEPDVILGRAKTVSVFHDQGIKLRQWELFSQDGNKVSIFIARLFHNNYYLYGRNIINRFLSHFDLRYLVITGDQSIPFQIPKMGIIYFLDPFLLIIGIFFLLKDKKINRNLLIFWWLISIIPAAFTYMTPSSNRTFNAVIPMVILIALGIMQIYKRFRFKIITPLILSILYTLCFGYFCRQYFLNINDDHADWWNYGWEQIAREAGGFNRYKQVVIPGGNMPYIYFLFYQKYSPDKFRKEAIRSYVADEFGYEHIEKFANYYFPSPNEWDNLKGSLDLNNLYIISSKEALNSLKKFRSIYYPNQQIMASFYLNE